MCLVSLVKKKKNTIPWTSGGNTNQPDTCCLSFLIKPGVKAPSAKIEVRVRPRCLTQITTSTSPENPTRRRGFSPRFLLRNSLNEFFLMSSFFLFSPPCLPTDILSFNSQAAWRAMEGAWERVGGRREGWSEKESLFQHQKTVLETRGNTSTLQCTFWWCLSVLWSQWYTTVATVN